MHELTRDRSRTESGCWAWAPGKGWTVNHDWNDDTKRTKRRRRAKRREHAAELEAERQEIEEEALLSPEERTYRRARRIADEKTRFASEALPVLLIGLFLLIWIWPVGLIVLGVWGRRPARRAYRLFIEPALREHLVEQEVERQVHATLSDERRSLETQHSRSMQHLSASIAHEIRNPITAAKSLVQQMEEDPTSRENTEYARVALEELQRVERSVSHLLRFARDEEMGIADVVMADVIDSALETFRDRFERAGVRVERDIDPEGQLRGDPEKLRRVIINLVGNAIDALEEGDVTDPTLEIASGENLAGTDIWVRIKDNGPGIPEETRQRLFSPFHTSKTNGTGLGLPICRKLVDAHGGSIEVDSQPGAGAEFLLTLPKRRREPEDAR